MDTLSSTPLSTVLTAALIAYWLYLWNKRVEFQSVAFSYRSVVTNREWWRLATSVFAHIEIMHLLFNVYSLWGCRAIETQKGSYYYFETSCILIVSGPCGEGTGIDDTPFELRVCRCFRGWRGVSVCFLCID